MVEANSFYVSAFSWLGAVKGVIMDRSRVKEIKEEYLDVLKKVECLLKIGVRNEIYEPYDLTSLKKQIKGFRSEKDIKEFKANGAFNQLCELTRVCGGVCCRLIVKPDSLVKFYECSQCPIIKFEETHL